MDWQDKVIVRWRFVQDKCLFLVVNNDGVSSEHEALQYYGFRGFLNCINGDLEFYDTTTGLNDLLENKQFSIIRAKVVIDAHHAKISNRLPHWLAYTFFSGIPWFTPSSVTMKVLFVKRRKTDFEFISCRVRLDNGLLSGTEESGFLNYNAVKKAIHEHVAIIWLRKPVILFEDTMTLNLLTYHQNYCNILKQYGPDPGMKYPSVKLYSSSHDTEEEETFIMNEFVSIVADLQMFPVLLSLSQITRLSCEQLCSRTILEVARIYGLSNFLRHKFWIQENVINETITGVRGGLVLETCQTYNPVTIYDYFMLYPSIAINYNLGIGTTFRSNVHHHALHTVLIKSNDLIKCVSVKSPKGPLAHLLEDLVNFRKEYGLRSAAGNACKLMANSIIGLTGNHSGSPFGGILCSAAISEYGRNMLEELQNSALNSGKKIVGGDTDSIFVETSPDDEVTNIGSNFPQWALNEKFTLLVENSFETFISFVKKRYVGITKDKKVVIKGISKNISSSFRNYIDALVIRLCSGDSLTSISFSVASDSFTHTKFVSFQDFCVPYVVVGRSDKRNDYESCELPVSAVYIFLEGGRGSMFRDVLRHNYETDSQCDPVQRLVRLVQHRQRTYLLEKLNIKCERFFMFAEANLRSNSFRITGESRFKEILKTIGETFVSTRRSLTLNLVTCEDGVYFDPPIMRAQSYNITAEQPEINVLLCVLAALGAVKSTCIDISNCIKSSKDDKIYGICCRYGTFVFRGQDFVNFTRI